MDSFCHRREFASHRRVKLGRTAFSGRGGIRCCPQRGFSFLSSTLFCSFSSGDRFEITSQLRFSDLPEDLRDDDPIPESLLALPADCEPQPFMMRDFCSACVNLLTRKGDQDTKYLVNLFNAGFCVKPGEFTVCSSCTFQRSGPCVSVGFSLVIRGCC